MPFAATPSFDDPHARPYNPRLVRVLALTALLVAACAAPRSAPPGELPPLELLQRLVRMNTYNNPERGHPGNELALVEWVADYLRGQGVGSVKVFETAPGRGCLVARLRGGGEPFLMMAHVDTVDVEPGQWTVDPLAGEIRDGFLWGRGAVDDKGMAACMIAAFVRAHRERTALSRDVILLLTADEEAGGELGVKFMVEHHLDEIRAAVAVNEGGTIVSSGGRVEFVAIQCTEKTMHNATLIASGTGGHSSRPHDDSAIDKLARAVDRVSAFQPPVKLNDVTQGFFLGRAGIERDADLAAHFRRLGEGDASSAGVVAAQPTYNAMLRSTVATTMLDAGIRFNVIPSEARATLNIRLLPGEEIDAFIDSLHAHLGRSADVRIEPEVPRERREPEAPPSLPRGPMYEAIERVARATYPDAVVMPSMSTGATDSRDLRLAGIPSYGILPFPMEESDLQRMHGNDERIPVGAPEAGAEFMYRLILEIAGP